MASLFVEKALSPALQLLAHILGGTYESNLANLVVYAGVVGVMLVIGLLGYWLIDLRSRHLQRAELHEAVRVELRRLLQESDVIVKNPPDWDELGRS